jgi:hypothetical protein
VTGEEWLTVALIVLLFVGIIAWYLASLATRLDRLHHRVESAAAALDNQLLRRAATSRVLAGTGLLDPASSLLLAASAAEAVAVGESGAVPDEGQPGAAGPREPCDEAFRDGALGRAREEVESDLSQALRATLTPDVVDDVTCDPYGRDLLADLGAACWRATLARRFHNDAVSTARRLRGKRLVRWTRLAGRARWPRTFEIDDEPPAGLPRNLSPSPS